MSSARVTLVTGLPGYRAAALSAHLLEHTRDDVWAVVLPSQRGRAEDLIQTSAHRERIRLFVGDPSAIDMGLGGAEYRELMATVKCIQHLEHVTEATMVGECEALNIGGMREVLELAAASARLESVVVHSSLAVSGDRVGYVAESELARGQRFSGPALATLARAELMARRSMRRLPIVVVRSAQVVGPAGDAPIEALTGVYLLLLLILCAPQDLSPLLGPFGDMPLNVVPIDFLVRASDALSRSPSALGRTLHLTDRSPMNVREAFSRCLQLRSQLTAAGVALPSPGSALFRGGSAQGSLQAILLRPRTFIDRTFRNVRYGTEGADEILGSLGLFCPTLETYLEDVVKHVVHAASSSQQISAAS